MPETAETVRPAAPAKLGDAGGFRLAVFGAVLVVALATGFGIGRLTGGGAGQAPAGQEPASVADGHAHGGDPAAGHVDPPGTPPHAHNADGGNVATAASDVGGLAVSGAGYTLVPERTDFVAGTPQQLRFTITGTGGAPVTTFAVVHDKPLHLVVARRDLTGFQHLHPSMAADGTWSIDLTLPTAGSWRMFTDFTAIGADKKQSAQTLGVDLTVAGEYAPVALPAPAAQAAVAGFVVAYEGTARTGATQPLLFRVTKGGAPAALQPYLGAYGHLVVLREGDLGYLHVHPEPQLADGAVKFWLAAPSAGRYRMFLDFQVDGAVHTAEFSLTVS